MSITNLSRRLERLENRLLPDTSEPMVLTVCFVSNDGSINDQMEVRLPAAPNQRGGRGGIDLHECVQEWAGPASKYVDVVVSRWQQGDGRTFDRISD